MISTRAADERLITALRMRDDGCTSAAIAAALGSRKEYWRAAISRVRIAYAKSEEPPCSDSTRFASCTDK